MENKVYFMVDVNDYCWHLGNSVGLYGILKRLNTLAAELPVCGETEEIKTIAASAEALVQKKFQSRWPQYADVLNFNWDTAAEAACKELKLPQELGYVRCDGCCCCACCRCDCCCLEEAEPEKETSRISVPRENPVDNVVWLFGEAGNPGLPSGVEAVVSRFLAFLHSPRRF